MAVFTVYWPNKHSLGETLNEYLLDVHPTNLHELQDAIQSKWANISKEGFQHLVESMPRRIKAVLKALRQDWSRERIQMQALF